MTDKLIRMPSLDEFDASGPVAQFLTSVLASVIEEVQTLKHKLECIENGGCEWHPGANSDDEIDPQRYDRPTNSIMGEAAERYEFDPNKFEQH